MNVLNRLLVILALLAAVAGASLLLLLILGLAPLHLLPDLPGLSQLVTGLRDGPSLGRLTVVLVFLGVVTLGLILLLLEVVPPQAGLHVRIVSRKGSTFSVDRASVRQLAQQTALATPGVVSFDVGVRPARRGVCLKGRARVEPGVALVDLGDALRERISQRVQDATGLKVLRCDVRFRFEPGDAPFAGEDDDDAPPPLRRAAPSRDDEEMTE